MLSIFAGRLTAHDIAAFAKDSAQTSVVVLGPGDFPDRVVNGAEPWFVDFYAPVSSTYIFFFISGFTFMMSCPYLNIGERVSPVFEWGTSYNHSQV